MAGIRKGSSDNLTSPIPHLLNADYLTAAARLAAGQVHYAGRDYYQRDTDVHYRLSSLSKCFLADGTTPATQAGTWGTLEAHWVQGGGGTGGAATPLYTTTGQNEDAAMTQKATTNTTGILVNLTTANKITLVAAINEVKAAQSKTAITTVGGILTSFASYEQAEAAAPVGSIITLVGYHAAIAIDKSVTVTGGTVGTAVIGYASTGITVLVQGLNGAGRFVVCPGAGADNNVEFANLITGPGFYFESYGFVGGPYKSNVNVINCRARNTAAYVAQANATQGSGLVHFQERANYSQWTFRNCDLRSDNNAVFTGYPAAATRVTLETSTLLTPGTGRPTQETSVLNSNVITADASFYVDNRANGTAFTAITANQYGTHPAFASQTALNAYLLGGTGTAPPPAPTMSNFTATPQ